MANEIIVEHIKKKEWEAAIPQITADACTDQQREKIFNDLNGLERMAVYREILKSMDTSKYNVKYFLLLKPSEQVCWSSVLWVVLVLSNLLGWVTNKTAYNQ